MGRQAERIVQTSLPNFRTTLYKNIQHSYVEFQRFAEQAQMTSPQSLSLSFTPSCADITQAIVPALPLASTSAVTDEEGTSYS